VDDAWDYTAGHLIQVAKALDDIREGRVRRLSDGDLAAHDEHLNSRIVGNRVAVQHATRMHQQNHCIVQQSMRQQMMNRQLVLLLGPTGSYDTGHRRGHSGAC
jgi:hypothetical protein